MLPDNRVPTHPGEVLLEEFLRHLGLTQVAFARHIGVPIDPDWRTIRWPGDLDVAPEPLYERITGKLLTTGSVPEGRNVSGGGC